MSATIGWNSVNHAMDGLCDIIWDIRDAIATNTAYPKDRLEMWRQQLIMATAILSDIQSVMKDEWEQERREAEEMKP